MSHPARTEPARESLAPAEGIHVLYVDDEEYVRQAFRRTLSRAGIGVTVCATPEEALAAVAQQPSRFTVFAADYQMGGMDGATLLGRVAKIAPSVTRILISGQFDVPRLVSAVNHGGIYQIVIKPWDSEQLLTLVRRASERCQLERDNARLLMRLEAQNDTLQRLNTELDARVMKRTTNLLDGLISALDLRDTETQWHSRRVSAYAKRLARQLGLSGQDLLDVEYGALLHDIGKIGISDTILLKPGKLTPEEWEVMRTHPRLGFDLLTNIDFLAGAAEIVHHHHERWDGGGYPQKLAGDQIAIGARIFSVVDALDVITTHRPYKRAQPYAWARTEIERCSGTQFDPSVVKAFGEIAEEEWSEIQRQYLGAGEA